MRFNVTSKRRKPTFVAISKKVINGRKAQIWHDKYITEMKSMLITFPKAI